MGLKKQNDLEKVSRQWMAEGRNFRNPTHVGAFEAVRKKNNNQRVFELA